MNSINNFLILLSAILIIILGIFNVDGGGGEGQSSSSSTNQQKLPIKLVAKKDSENRNHLKLSADGLTATVLINERRELVWADRPFSFPASENNKILYYYEVKIENNNKENTRSWVNFGMTNSLDSTPYSNLGLMVNKKSKNDEHLHFEWTFENGDIFGCGLFQNNGNYLIFFTKISQHAYLSPNGKGEMIEERLTPLPPNADPKKLFAFMEIFGKGTKIMVNFDEKKMKIKKSEIEAMLKEY